MAQRRVVLDIFEKSIGASIVLSLSRDVRPSRLGAVRVAAASTGEAVWRTPRSAVLPSRTSWAYVQPWVPMTIRSTACRLAEKVIS